MFLRHGDDFLAIGSIHRAHWNPEAQHLLLRIGPSEENVTLAGDDALRARATLVALCPEITDDAGTDS